MWDRVCNLPRVIDDPISTVAGYGTEHKWTKRSILWDLPYWKDNMLRHNLDVMHIEKNVFDNMFNTVMDIKGKTKDTLNGRKDMSKSCDRPEIAVPPESDGPKPKAAYTLSRDQKRMICQWLMHLRFPDGYASNLGRCVDMTELKLHGMKTHDAHVFMERLLPIAFRELLPGFVWNALTELSLFFQQICLPIQNVSQLQDLEDKAPILLCNLEKIFPPSFFDSMEHLIIHLPYEVRIGGPVQYRWMYPFERFV